MAVVAAVVGFTLLTAPAVAASAEPPAAVVPAGKAPKPKRVKLGCARKADGTLRFISRTRQCRSRVGKLLRLDPGPAEVCVRKRGSIKPRSVVAARRVANQVAVCAKKRKSNETPLKLPSARDEFFCVEKRSKAMRWFNGRPRCRTRGKLAEFAAFVAKAPPVGGGGGAPGGGAPGGQANRAPFAQADSAAVNEDSTAAVAVLANDADPDGETLAVGAVDPSGARGDVTAGPGGAVTYDPAGRFNDLRPGQTATDSFAYTAHDPSGAQSGPARVQVTIGGVNDAPTLAAGSGPPSTFTEDQAGAVPVDPALSISDVDSDDLTGATVTIAGGRASGDALQFTGTSAITGTYDSGTGVLTLTGTAPLAEYRDALRSVQFSTSSQDPGGSRTIEFRANDGEQSAPAARQVVVAPVNDAPSADDETLDGASRAVGNTSLVVNDPSDGAPDPAGPQKTVTGDLLAGDTDVDGPALGVRAETVSTLDGGQAILEADGDFTYRPPQGCTGGSTDAFEYTLEDNHPSAELTDEGKVTITVAECVWYVDDSAAAGGDGRSDAPYNTLTDLDGGTDEDASGHRLFLYDGTYSGPLPLEANQSLFSEKHGLALADGGTGTVTLEPADGAGTQLQGGLQLATGNNVQGLDLGTTGSSSVFALSGSSVGTASVNNQTSGGINNPAGGAVSIAGTGNTVNMQFGELSSSGSATNAVTLTNTSGTFSASTGTVQSATNATVALNGGNADFTFGAALSDNTGQALSIQNKTGGTNDFNGAITGGTVALQTNGGTTRFDGGLTLSTGASDAFVASNAGTLAITDPNGPGPVPDNRIAANTGRPLSVTSTTIHSDDLNFARISSDGAPNGIVLSSTGSGGGLNVTGTGGTCDGEFTCTGGAIKNSTGPGLQLTNVGGGVDLTRMVIQNGGNDGISGSAVDGFALRNSFVTGNGNAAGESGIDFAGLTGQVALASDTVTGNAAFNVAVANTSGALDMDVTGGTYGNTSAAFGEDGILVDANNTASQTLTVEGGAFTNNRGDHVQASTGSTGSPTQDVTIEDTVMTSTNGSPDIAGGGITVSPAGAAAVKARILSNSIQNAKSNAIRVDTTGSSTGTVDARITGNTIGTPATPRSGSFSANGILLGANGGATLDALVSGNGIHQYTNTHGLLIQQGAGANAKVNATVTGNTLSTPNNALGGAGGVKAEAGVINGDAGVMCLDLGGTGAAANNLGSAGNEITSPSPLLDTRDVRVTQNFGARIQFPGLGATTTDAAVATYLAGRNTGPPSVAAASNPANTGFQSTNNPCPQPEP